MAQKVKVITKKQLQEDSLKELHTILNKDIKVRGMYWLENFNKISGLFPRETAIKGGEDDDNPIKFVMQVPEVFAKKYGINTSATSNSQEQRKISGSKLRAEVRQDDTLGPRDDLESNKQG